MDDPYEMFVAGQREFGARVHAVDEQQWSAPTPCSDWTVADLVRHLVDEHRWAAPLVHGQDLEGARLVVEGTRSSPVGGGVGADLAAEWDEAALQSADAFADDGALERSVRLTRGPAPARAYLVELTVDLVVHAWDLGEAIGHDSALRDDLVAAVHGDVERAVGPYASMFAVPVDVPDDAPAIDRLVARTGRDPNWRAA